MTRRWSSAEHLAVITDCDSESTQLAQRGCLVALEQPQGRGSLFLVFGLGIVALIFNQSLCHPPHRLARARSQRLRLAYQYR